MRRYYAAQSPRGFANEIKVYSFASRTARDKWVDEHRDDGGVNSAACGAYVVSAIEARRICQEKGDAATEIYNSREPVQMY